MPPHRRMTASEYRAKFKPVEPREDEDQEISDAESGVGDYQNDMHGEALMVVPQVGWTSEVHFKAPQDDAFFHDLLTRTLATYNEDLQAKLEYRSVEHRHPLMRAHWDTELRVKSLDATTKTYKMETFHYGLVSRDTAEQSMEDAAYNALVHYLGRRYDGLPRDALTHYPRYVPEQGTWTIDAADGSSPTLQATVELARVLVKRAESLEYELLYEKLINDQQRAEMDRLRTELGRPKLHEKINKSFTQEDPTP